MGCTHTIRPLPKAEPADGSGLHHERASVPSAAALQERRDKTSMTAIVWLRQDLRVRDNPALLAAERSGRPVLPLYILDEGSASAWKPGGASRWWLAGSLDALDRDLAGVGSRLVRRRGDPARIFTDLQPESVFWNDCGEPWIREQDQRIRLALQHRGVRTETFETATLFRPGEVRNSAGYPYRVYTAFARACGEPVAPLPMPARLPRPDCWPEADSLDLLPRAPDWANGLRATWEPGSQSARSRIKAFEIDNYREARDIPAIAGTSRLSPHLHFGEISAREVWECVSQKTGPGADKFRGELLWREFAHHLLHHFPDLPDEPLQQRFRRFPWRDDPEELALWQRGATGYPVVDAGMRELWETGWMHNRVRMIVGSFLTKHLLLDWREGARWFWDTLVDADLANNTAGWQWIAGCGADAVPFFRIFNPVLQGERFDREGSYVRRWVPELADLPARSIHKPWTLPAPPKGYPAPWSSTGLRGNARWPRFARRDLKAEPLMMPREETESTPEAPIGGPASRRPVAAVIGSGNAGEETERVAEQLGRCLVDAGFRVLTGGLGGVMEAASRGARSSSRHRDGDVVGVLPGYQSEAANPHVDIAICTGLGHARNVLCAASGDVVLAVAGNSGTLSEIALAWTLGKPVACVGHAEGWASTLAGKDLEARGTAQIAGPFSPQDAVAWSIQEIASRRGTYH